MEAGPAGGNGGGGSDVDSWDVLPVGDVVPSPEESHFTPEDPEAEGERGWREGKSRGRFR